MEYFARFLREVIQEPCTVIASSLAGAYAIQTAADCPELIESLILVCPTGMHHLSDAPGARSELAYQALRSPVAGTAAYNLLTSEASLRSYLMNNTYFDPSYVDDAMIEHYSTASHQYGSQFAPPAFISGLLNYSVRSVFPRLTQKTIRLVWGREAKQTPLEDLEAFLAANGRAEPTIFDKSGLLPHDEQAQGFNRLVVEIINADKPKRTRTKTSAVAEPPSDAEGG